MTPLKGDLRKALTFLVAFLFSVSLTAQINSDDFHLYLIGDAGKVNEVNAAYKKFLQQQLNNDTVPSAIVFLGDNIYPKGMPEEGSRARKKTEEIMLAQIALANNFNGKIFFVPGNHDWKGGRKDGLQFILNQQAWVDSLHNDRIQVLPNNGCPGPIEIPLSDKLVLIVIDTQWWLHPWEKPEGETSTCECKTPAEVVVQLDDMLRRNKNKRIVVAGHHPVITYGEHGGVYSFKDHIFPFTGLKENLYIPLPIIGSIYPLYRQIFGS